jgi:hypothetical protein
MTTDRVTLLLGLASQEELVQILRAANRQLEPKAAAVYLNVSVRCLEEWRKQGIGPKWRKIGKRVFYCINGLDAFLGKGLSSDTDAEGN